MSFPEPENICNSQLLSPEELAKVVALLPFLKSWIKSVEERAEELAHKEQLPGWKLVEGRRSRGWADEDKAAKLLRTAGIEEDKLYTRSFVSVAQAEKLVGKKAFAPMQKTLVEVKAGKPALAPEDSPKPAIQRGSEFEKVKP